MAYYKDLNYWKNQPAPKPGKKFIDPFFPPNENSLLSKNSKGEYIDKIDGPDRAKRIDTTKIEWMRASDIFKGQKYLLFEGKIEMADINQGILGDCYVLASAAALTEFPNLVYQMFKTKSVNHEGYFEVIFFIDGKFQIVIVDDYLPVDKETKKLCYSRPNRNEIWVCILEKAWAKVNGGYSNIIKGWMHQTLETFTGFASVSYNHDKCSQEVLWDSLNYANKKNCIIACCTKSEVESLGLVNSHAYTLMDALEITSKGKKVKLVKIRNTWGFKEWTGDWSDKSPLWGPEELKQVELNQKDNGEFFMSLEDYYKNYSMTDICYTYYNSHSKSYKIEGDDLNKGNVFNIYLEKDGLLSISLIRKFWRFNRELHNTIIPTYLSLMKYDPNKIGTMEFLSNYDARNESYEDTCLTKWVRKGFYLVYAYHDLSHGTNPGEEYYYVKIDSESKFKHKKMPCDLKENGFPLLKQLIIQGVVDAKNDFKPGENYSSFVTQFKKDGLGHRLIFNSKDKWMVYSEDLSEVKNMFMISPYDNKKKQFDWYIPPKSWNVILGMERNSEAKSLFQLKAKAVYVKNKPEDYVEHNINLKDYANEEVFKEKNNRDDYYDYSTISLEKAKEDLTFESINMSEMTDDIVKKQYPKLWPYLQKLPKNDDSGLSWSIIPEPDDIYIGQVNKNNKKGGRCAFIINKNDQAIICNYDGEKDEFNGKGFITSSDFNTLIFEGNFVKSQKNGFGELYLSSGDKYKGEFKDNKRHGKGIYTFKNGCTWEGNFIENKMDGDGIYTNAKGKKSNIKFKNGQQVQ